MNFSFKRIVDYLLKKITIITVKDINQSTVKLDVYTNTKIIPRTEFIVTEKWIEHILDVYHDDEIKTKYIPELHQSGEFEEENLKDLINYKTWVSQFSNEIRVCLDYIERFENSYKEFFQLLSAENINIIDPNHPILINVQALFKLKDTYKKNLISLKSIFDVDGFKSTNDLKSIEEIPTTYEILNTRRSARGEILDKPPSDPQALRYLTQHHNQVYSTLIDLRRMFTNWATAGNCKIIAGNAGAGKTHLSAHIVKKLRESKQPVVFLKPKLFSGDDVNFDETILRLLEIPVDYTLIEILDKLDYFAQTSKKRFVIIIDALNETTKSTIGFSNIWKNHLQRFINQIKGYPNLYFLCTLRISYIEHIWDIRPPQIVELKGFDDQNIREACEKYFRYYKIVPTNWDFADLNYFKIPLLLDLFCKLTNEKRAVEVKVELGVHTYLQIFEDYIKELTAEVKDKLSLQKDKPIVAGLSSSSVMFFENNEAVISIEQFSDAFDKDDNVSKDESIAKSVLEGYLIFIKDFIGRKEEIVKHTQQEVGGYLLAKQLSNSFTNIEELVHDNNFKEKIIGTDTSKHHQLRLDILKFLIALRPEIVNHLDNEDSNKLSWWYLFNGYQPNASLPIPAILTSKLNVNLASTVLSISVNQWFNVNSTYNFLFVSDLLEKFSLWDYNLTWTYFIYQEFEFFFDVLNTNIGVLKKKDQASYPLLHVVARFAAYTTSTNIRELRDLSTVFLIEYGKIHPLELLNLTVESTKFKDIYIYERLVSSCYGVALNRQNDNEYINSILPAVASDLYNLQFAKTATAMVYNYVVIDSIKHLVDLAIFKGVLSLDDASLKRLVNYKYSPPYDWKSPTEMQLKEVNESRETSWPPPIGMDFGIYTIPRLVREEGINQRVAIANVYKRIYEIGYLNSEPAENSSESFKEFVRGYKLFGRDGKVDKLSKKYSWMAFFDYAGFLLKNNQLAVFTDDDALKKYYRRLSDVSIDISLVPQNYALNERLYQGNLLENRGKIDLWQSEDYINSVPPLFQNIISSDSCVMLYGKIDQRLSKEYEVRSFLLIETFFIKNREGVSTFKKDVSNHFFDWKLDVHNINDSVRHTYFGELFWADNIFKKGSNALGIPTGRKVKRKRTYSPMDMLHLGIDKREIGKVVEEEFDEQWRFESEPTLTDFLWESDSDVIPGVNEFFPSIKMGKGLDLKADPENFRIVDNDLKPCFFRIKLEDENYFSNDFNYMRTDLIKKHMIDNDLSLVYQVKQHSYEKDSNHHRSMKFFITEHSDI